MCHVFNVSNEGSEEERIHLYSEKPPKSRHKNILTFSGFIPQLSDSCGCEPAHIQLLC